MLLMNFFVYFLNLKKIICIFISFVKDKNDLENTYELGKSFNFLFLYSFIFFISSLDIFAHLYNIFLLAKGNYFNLTPLCNVLI